MDIRRRAVFQGADVAALAALGVAEGGGTAFADGSSNGAAGASGQGALDFDSAAWSYDSASDVYYQIGAAYVADPAAADYENLSIYVPGAYLTASLNSDGTTYTARLSQQGTVGAYSARTAPIVVPVNTPGYSAQSPATSYSYSAVAQYLEAGFIYVWPGMRGTSSSTSTLTGDAPWGVTDLKAAIRYLRYNRSVLPGSTDDIFLFGMSGGGAQDTVAGSSGDSALYFPYLRSIGAAMRDAHGRPLSDAVAGVMAWCPITSLHEANLSYEWNMGQFASTDTVRPAPGPAPTRRTSPTPGPRTSTTWACATSTANAWN